MRSTVTVVVAVLATLGLACASGPELRDPQARIAAKRLAALPTQGKITVVGPEGGADADQELSTTVRKNVDDSINYLVHQHGGHVFGREATLSLEHYTEFENWSWHAMHQIIAERLGKAPAAHRSVAEWRFPGDLASWRPVLNSDFVLVSFILYTYRPPKFHPDAVLLAQINPYLAMGELLVKESQQPQEPPDSTSITGAGSRAIACVVAIDGGRIVWCNFIPNNSVTMQERPAAQSAVDVLLTDMLKLAD